jgi:hypothetical protein
LQIEAFVVDRYINRNNILGLGCRSQQRILRILNPHFVAGRKEDFEAHQKAELASRCDDHLFGACSYAAQSLRNAADRFPQFFVALRIGVDELERVLLNVFDENVGEFSTGTRFA